MWCYAFSTLRSRRVKRTAKIPLLKLQLLKPPTAEAADELVVKLRLWVSSVTLSRPKIMMGLRCYHQVGRAAGCRPSPTQSWSQKERELPIPCNFLRRSRCLGKWAATVWRRRWNSWKIKHSRAITNNLLALHHPENALFLRNWLQSSLVLYTKDYTWPIISSSRLLKANHPFCSCRNPILISQKISWGISLTITINLGCVCKITHLKSTLQALRATLVIFSKKIIDLKCNLISREIEIRQLWEFWNAVVVWERTLKVVWVITWSWKRCFRSNCNGGYGCRLLIFQL